MSPLANKLFHTPDEIVDTVLRFGFLPFFRGDIPSFSIEEHTPSELWFSDTQDGPWEWKGPIIRSGKVAYAKLFRNKAAFIAPDLLPHIVNVRRHARPMSYHEERVLRAIIANESMLSTEIRDECGFAPRSRADILLNASDGLRLPSLDSLLSRLQMAAQIVVSDFEYNIDKKGRPYGWGIARYSTPEILYADWFDLPTVTPDESRAILASKILTVEPSLGTKIVNKIIG